MGQHVIKMPDIGEGIAEVELVGWKVGVGDAVAEDQIIAEVMTDKATVEIPSPVAGTVLALGGALGETLAVGSALIRLEVVGDGNVKPGEAASAGSAASEKPAVARAPEPPPRLPDPKPEPEPEPVPAAAKAAEAAVPANPESRIPASPAKPRWPRRRCADAPGIWASNCASCRPPAPAGA